MASRALVHLSFGLLTALPLAIVITLIDVVIAGSGTPGQEWCRLDNPPSFRVSSSVALAVGGMALAVLCLALPWVYYLSDKLKRQHGAAVARVSWAMIVVPIVVVLMVVGMGILSTSRPATTPADYYSVCD
jgi:hypothetical protein